jgi:hypothetical protein
VQRSVRPQSRGGYTDSTPTVLPPDFSGRPTLDIRDGEQSIYEQYKLGTHHRHPCQCECCVVCVCVCVCVCGVPLINHIAAHYSVRCG